MSRSTAPRSYVIVGRLIFFFFGHVIAFLFLRGSQRVRVIVRDPSGTRVAMSQTWLGDGVWEVIGGGRAKGESAEAAVVRELHEETGLQVEQDRLTHIGSLRESKRGFSYDSEIFLLDSATTELRRSKFELAALEWRSVRDLPPNYAELLRKHG